MHENEEVETIFDTVELVFVCIFIVEVGIKIWAMGRAFFQDHWNTLDFFVVVVCPLPHTSHRL